MLFSPGPFSWPCCLPLRGSYGLVADRPGIFSSHASNLGSYDHSDAQRSVSHDAFPALSQPDSKTPSNINCYHYPLEVNNFFSRVDLFNGLLGPVQVTALYVTLHGNASVAHMGTADGRILQVRLPSSSEPFIPWSLSPSLFCSQLTCPRWSLPGISTTCCLYPTSRWAIIGSPCNAVSVALETTCSLPLGIR